MRLRAVGRWSRAQIRRSRDWISEVGAGSRASCKGSRERHECQHGGIARTSALERCRHTARRRSMQRMSGPRCDTSAHHAVRSRLREAHAPGVFFSARRLPDDTCGARRGER